MTENLKPTDVHVKDSRFNRIFVYFLRDSLARQYPVYSAESIKTALDEMISRQPVKVDLRPHQFAVVPRIHQDEGQCNWQIAVFLPIPPDDLTAIRLAAADLQKRCNLRQDFQDARPLIV